MQIINTVKTVPVLSSKQDYAYKRLKDMIISNQLPAGTLLVERSLSELLQISRTPVRVALTQLANEGFAIFYPGRGMAVAEIKAQDVAEIYSLREVLDVLSTRLFVENASIACKVELEENVRLMEEALAAGNLQAVAEHDRGFHNIFRCNSGNKRLEYALGSLMDQVDRLLYYAKNDPERTGKSVREHREIFEAVRRNDTQGAEQAMYAHISGLKAYHLNWVQEYISKVAGF